MSQKLRIGSLSEFVSGVRTIERRWKVYGRTTPAWFRGQADASWSLVPGLYRGGISYTLEREMTRDFALYAAPFLSAQSTNTALERLFVMQHYGLPTRLLDWTESHLVALFFAVVDHTSPKDAAVFALDPWRLNEVSIGQR